MPVEFIGIAEESGLIAEVGDFVLREACSRCDAGRGIQAAAGDFQVHVNVSPRQLRSDHLMGGGSQVLAETGLDPARLMIEMTESFVGEHGDVASERMRELKTLGVGLAIDDFGTGYSSLAILQDMPFDILKVDRAFIDDVDDDARGRAFTAAIFGLGNTLGLTHDRRGRGARGAARRAGVAEMLAGPGLPLLARRSRTSRSPTMLRRRRRAGGWCGTLVSS